MVNGVLLRPLPYGERERLVVVRQTLTRRATPSLGFSEKELIDYRAAAATLEDLVEYHTMSFTLLGGREAQRVQTGVVSPGFFDFLGVRPLVGRTFRAEDDTHGAEAVLILSHGYWMRRFGGDPGVVGRVFRMNDRPHTVVGVLPPCRSSRTRTTSTCRARPARSACRQDEPRSARLAEWRRRWAGAETGGELSRT